MPNQLRVALYMRYSSHKQNEQSIEGQHRVCKEFAERNGYEITAEYIDRATSAKTDNRPEFRRMITEAQKNQWDAVLVYKLDRFARNRYDSAIYKAKLRKYGISVLSAMENIADSPEGVILESVLEGMAEYYSADLSQKVTRGMLEGAHKCQTNGVKIFGYTETPDKRYAIDNNKAPAVRTIFEMYNNGETTKDIIKWLKSNGYKTLENKDFSYSKINRILSDERYTGIYKFADVVINGGIPALIDSDTYNKAKKRAAANKHASAANKAEVKYMLTFKLFCGECGAAMAGESGRSKNGSVYHYYKCSARKKGGNCKGRSIRKEYIEDIVVNSVIDNILKRPDVIDKIAATISKIFADEAEANNNREHLEKALAEKEKAIGNLLTAIEQGIFTPSTKERLEELEAEREDIKFELSTSVCVAPEISKNEIVNYFNYLAQGNASDIKYRKKIVDMFVNSVFLFDDKIVIVYNYGHNPNGGGDKVKSELPLKEIAESSDIASIGVPIKIISEHLCVWNKMLLSIVHLTK